MSALWTVEDVHEFLRDYARSPSHLTVDQLPSWWFNLVLRIEADGEQLILRRYGVTPPDEVRWELALLGHLQHAAFPAIRPLPRSDGDHLGEFLGRPAILYPFVEGRSGCDLEWSLALAATVEAIARLHEITLDLRIPHPRTNSGAEPRRLIRSFLQSTADRGAAAKGPALREFVQRVAPALEEFEAHIAQHAGILPRGVVHHDAHCRNVLFQHDRLVALIDFDDAFEGHLVADLAVMVVQWAADRSGDHLDGEKAMRVVHEYERHRALTSGERELLADFMRLYMLSDAAQYIDGQVEQGVDVREAVASSTSYKRYLNTCTADWLATL
jgi:homoserine kinase type II